MNQSKLVDFLHSIGIENIEDFDLELITVRKDGNGTFLFTFLKNSCWDYEKLIYFIHHLQNITKYKYEIDYEYTKTVSINDVADLFKQFYYCETRNKYLGSILIGNDEITLKTNDINEEDFISLRKDFLSCLKSINYPTCFLFLSEDESNIEEEIPFSSEIECDLEEDDKEKEEICDIQDEELSEKDDFDCLNTILHEVTEADELEYAKIAAQNREKYSEGKSFTFQKRKPSSDFTLSQIRVPDMSVRSNGTIFSVEMREFNSGSVLFKFGVHDGNDAIYCTVFSGKNHTVEDLSGIKVGDNVEFCGISQEDKFQNNEICIKLYTIKVVDKTPLRTDDYDEKRVELHAHTKMSNMDAVATIQDYCELAKSMGHKAIAITDHGVVQGFPAAQKAAAATGIKILYGAELYVVDDAYRGSYRPNDKKLKDLTYVVYDLETTGLSIKYDKIIEFGAVKVVNGLVVDTLDILINPGMEISQKIQDITNITNEMVERKPTIDKCIDEIMEFIGDSVLVSHNLEFDYGFLNEALVNLGRGELKSSGIDTLALSRFTFPSMKNHRLGTLCRQVEVFYDEDSAHRANYDAKVLSDVWEALLFKLTDQNKNVTLNDIAVLKKRKEHIIHSREMHVTVLARNKAGLKDLYKLISFSHIDYFGRVPCVPKSLLTEYRKNLILGSCCFNGEVFDNATRSSKETLDKAVAYYDFIEIQPIENYSYLINMGNIADEHTLIKYIKDIENSAQAANKPLCVTGDCHYVNPEDKIFRDIYIFSLGVGKSSHPLNPFSRKKYAKFENPDQYYRSTRELMDEFTPIFGEEKAKEYIIKNTNAIADLCEMIVPIEDHLYTPTIENCEQMLSDICYGNAHKLYGDVLPEIVKDRLDKELSGIIGGGYSVIYYIAHKIIKKSNDDGYIVGSRGSVGSSFVATMADITEVNSLPPHYRCPKCKHFELYEGKDFLSGYDLPDKVCPECGELMIADGQNIPFETFLGYNAGKVPDIDLNFPPDYQAIAHDYTKVLLGEKNVYRAGTIGTVADKTAFGYVKGYLERTGSSEHFTNAKIAYLASGCVDVKRTTGQHPGGIVVIPKGHEVYDFTPVQYPADDMDANWQTTHLDFHAIHDTILKLDLLGHVDPQILKNLSDSTHVLIKDIPLSDKKVISLFSKPDALNLKHNYLHATNGAVALPEFGTDFVRKMLDDTHPSTFADLVILSGLSHGTNVWRGNAETLIETHTTDLHGVIGCRDDIMTYLISIGMDTFLSFNIMEKVRKGFGLKDEWKKEMKEHGVPDFYIDSCLKIKYLFPKAHATAYVTNAIRVAWFKVYRPLDFYAAYFTYRCDNYEWETMLGGEKAILKRLDELADFKKSNAKEYSKKYEEIEKVLNVSLEMYDRGYKFRNIDLYESDDTKFVPDYDDKSIIPPFKVIDGLGTTVAMGIINARNEHKFISIEDLVNRGKVNNTQIEIFRRLHILDGMAEKEIEQLSLFDF